MPGRAVRATYDDTTIVVYQAYRPEIAGVAVSAGRFGPPFSRDRMTWVKPSFTWMAYRSGWATKEGQERVLAVRVTRAGWEWALEHACLSHYDEAVHASRDALPDRSIQVGLSGEALARYVDEWTVSIEDATALCHRLAALPPDQRVPLLPATRPYPLPDRLRAYLGAD